MSITYKPWTAGCEGEVVCFKDITNESSPNKMVFFKISIGCIWEMMAVYGGGGAGYPPIFFDY